MVIHPAFQRDNRAVSAECGRRSGADIRIILFLIALLFPPVIVAQSVNLPVSHWAYAFLDRLEIRGVFSSPDFSSRPYPRNSVARIIAEIDAKVRTDPTLLSSVEHSQFDRLKGEFHEALARVAPEVDTEENEHERHLFSISDEDVRLNWDALSGYQLKAETKEETNPGIPKSVLNWGSSFRLNIKNSMVVYSEARSFIFGDTDSLANTVFNPSLGLPITRQALADLTVSDNASAYVVFAPPWLDLELGRDLVEWGPAQRGNLILSRNSNFYDAIKLSFRSSSTWKFEYLHAWLNADFTKYLVAHRVEFRLLPWLQLGFSESLIYGRRGVEPFYLNPFVPIIIAERHVGNQDNNMVGFDASVLLPKQRAEIYLEILFDDFSLAKNIFNNFVNKWGVTVGAFLVDPLGLEDSEIKIELTRIQPLVYSHRDPTNTYSNYNNTLGHWLGPDADDWYIEFAHRLHRDLRVSTSWERQRRGENDINEGERPADGKIHFLAGTIEKKYLYGLNVEWQVFRDFFLNINYNFIRARNLRRIAGFDQNNHRLLLSLALNY